jgi:hypothetical protein
MKAGVVYPQIELGGDTGAVKAFAQAAEDLGYDHIVIYDHVLGAVHEGREPKLTGPYEENDPFHEPLVTYAYLADDVYPHACPVHDVEMSDRGEAAAREGAREHTAARERHVHCGVTFHAPGNAALGLFPRFGQARRRCRDRRPLPGRR